MRILLVLIVELARAGWQVRSAIHRKKPESRSRVSDDIRIPPVTARGQDRGMDVRTTGADDGRWMLARLELARTPEFPEGSPAHSYLLRLPLEPDGMIDRRAHDANPRHATVRRHWPGMPERTGYIVRKGAVWAFSYALGESDDEELFHLENHPIALGGYVTLTEPDGERLPFRVVALAED